MSLRRMPRAARVVPLAAVLALGTAVSPGEVMAQAREAKPGFNIFSAEQDIEIGRQSAAEAERQLPLLNDRHADEYVNRLVRELAAHAPGHRFPYQARVVNASDINAFALPGGFLYLNRGLVQAARTEGELVGVVSHEMAHIALRHGTHQASKAYLAQAGLGILGGLVGRGNPSQVFNAIGGLGLNALFLKFSRGAESQADQVGAQMMARAGYDPNEMATFFDLLAAQRQRQPGAVEQFFSSHPAPANRAAAIRQHAATLGGAPRRGSSAEFQRVRSNLQALGPAPTLQQIARGQGGGGSRVPTRQAQVRVEAPSGRYRTFDHPGRYFSIQHPDNWEAYASSGFGVTIAPRGGVVDTGDGQQSIVYGVIVNHYDPFEARRGDPTLQEATQDLLAQIQRTNPHLRVSGGLRRQRVEGAPGFSAVLSGRSPVTGREERVTAFTRELADGHVVYALFIAPGDDYRVLSPTFERMMQSLSVNDSAAHR